MLLSKDSTAARHWSARPVSVACSPLQSIDPNISTAGGHSCISYTALRCRDELSDMINQPGADVLRDSGGQEWRPSSSIPLLVPLLQPLASQALAAHVRPPLRCRDELFDMINEEPTCYETVVAKNGGSVPPPKPKRSSSMYSEPQKPAAPKAPKPVRILHILLVICSSAADSRQGASPSTFTRPEWVVSSCKDRQSLQPWKYPSRESFPLSSLLEVAIRAVQTMAGQQLSLHACTMLCCLALQLSSQACLSAAVSTGAGVSLRIPLGGQHTADSEEEGDEGEHETYADCAVLTCSHCSRPAKPVCHAGILPRNPLGDWQGPADDWTTWPLDIVRASNPSCAHKSLMQAYRREPHSEDDDDADSDDDDEEGDNETYADGEGDPCPNCGRIYKCALLVCATRLSFCWQAELLAG